METITTPVGREIYITKPSVAIGEGGRVIDYHDRAMLAWDIIRVGVSSANHDLNAVAKRALMDYLTFGVK